MTEQKVKTNKPKTTYKLVGIKETEFHIKNLPQEVLDSIDEKKIRVTFGVRLIPDMENGQLLIGFKVKYDYDINGTIEQILGLEFFTNFSLENYENIMFKDDEGDPSIEENFLINLLGIIIGTARGILFTKTRGSIFNRFYLPIVNPRQLLASLKIPKHTPK